MNLSKNLSKEEFIYSKTAKSRGIDNDFASIDHQLNAIALAEYIFQPLRTAMGIPILCTSGYRSPKLNKAIGGAGKSQHTVGEAIDLSFKNKEDNYKLFHYIKINLPFDQLIWEKGDDNSPQWVHVSFKRNWANRGEVLRTDDGKKYYRI